jgi:hypothetical protein
MPRFRSLALSFVAFLILATFSLAAAPDRISMAVNTASTAALGLGVAPHIWNEPDQGPVDPAMPLTNLTLLISPAPAQQKAIEKLLAEQQDPHSPNYHKWLTPEQYGERFGLSPNDAKKITSWLQSQGFTNVKLARSSNVITFSGTALQAQHTFGTEIHRFGYGETMHFSNVSAPRVPAALSGIVTSMRGLNNSHLKPMVKKIKRDYVADNSFTGQFVGPPDVATIYDINNLYTAGGGNRGGGQTLAIIGQTDIFQADISDFRTGFGLSAITGCTSSTKSPGVITACSTANFKYVLYLPTGGTDPLTPSPGDLSESDLDIEWSGAIAQNAQVIFVNAPDPNGNGVVDSMQYAITNNVAPVVSMSYGLCELYSAENTAGGFANFTEAEFQQANLQGQTIVNSTGDQGAVSCDPIVQTETLAEGGYAVSYPASSPEVTAVGGTLIPQTLPNEYGSTYWNTTGTTGGSAQTYTPEQAWNDNEQFGAVCADPTDFPVYAQYFCTPLGVTNWSTAQDALGFIAGGGGVSNCATIDANNVCLTPYPQPSYQSGLNATAINPNGYGVVNSTAPRYVPDVALLASPYFPGLIYCTPLSELSGTAPYDTESTSSCAPGGASGIAAGVAGIVQSGNYVVDPSVAGGTSFATPIFAGIVTLLNQYLNAGAPGSGNINPALYAMAANPNPSFTPTFNTITTDSTGSYSAGAYCVGGTPSNQPAAMQCPTTGPTAGFLGFNTYDFDPTTNYNLVTGLGSVDVYNLAQYLTAGRTGWAFQPPSSGTQTASAGQSVSYTFTVNPPTGGIFLAAVSFSCGTAPDPYETLGGTACSFSPATIPVGTKVAQTITMTLQTAGPNPQTGAARHNRKRAENRLPLLPFTLPIAGVVLAGFAGRKLSKYSVVGSLCLALAMLGVLVACGGGGGGGGSNPISVSVSLGTPTGVYPTYSGWGTNNQTATFTATVNNDTSGKGVTWTAGLGTITSTDATHATYTPPTLTNTLPSSDIITATSVADTSKSGTSTETLLPATVPSPTPYTITVNATLGQTSQSQQVTVQVN